LKAKAPHFQLNRREFIKVSSLGGIWLVTRNLTGFASEPGPAPAGSVSGWSGAPGKARYRIEGLAKVLGQKIYARDFRARDMAGWPAREVYAMVLRTPVAGRKLEGIDLSTLPQDLQPLKMVSATDLAKDQLVFPRSDRPAAGRTSSLFAAVGSAAEFLGQPVAILLFPDYRTYFRARRLLQSTPSLLRFSNGTPAEAGQGPHGREAYAVPREDPDQAPSYMPPRYLTRYAQGSTEMFSQVMDGFTDPSGSTPGDQKAAMYRSKIIAEVESNPWAVYRGVYETQQLDPMFMEPESGLGWLDRESSTLHLVVGTQSSNGCVSDSITMFGSSLAFKKEVETIVLHACYPGGGFGGRDNSTFSTLLAIAAAYADRPVRMAYDRFEQFQSGVKQLGARMSQTLAVDSEGRFQAVIGDYQMRAGGRNNHSQWVAELAGYCGGSGYAIPRVTIDAKARSSIGVIAGSMRGFGGPQAAFALESLIDEIAAERKIDAIELRRRNALAQGGCTVTGYRVSHSLRIAEICERAGKNPLWANRESGRRRYASQSMLYGVGFGLANQAFGTGNDGMMAAVEIGRDGAITVTTNCVDMGNGAATSLAVSTGRLLGANATRVRLGEVTLFKCLAITNLPKDDWNNPQYTPALSMSSSACITAFHQVHVVEQACRVLLENSIWPWVSAQWGLPSNQPFPADQVQWRQGTLTMSGKQPLSWRQLVSGLHDRGAIVGAMVHASYLGQWIQATFPLPASLPTHDRTWTGAIDALAVSSAGGDWTIVNRANVVQPPPDAWRFGRCLHTPSGCLAAVLVDPRNGKARILDIDSYLEAGRVVQPDLLLGQYYGGVAMGAGYVLHEESPQTYGGPGEGRWNLNRYHVPMWNDLPLDRIRLELLEPAPGEAPRGIAEAVLCPVLPALANAIAHATGKRFRSLPITPGKILEALNPNLEAPRGDR
jgi:CO/xanthine dehydrogenase Mo-binding subunit